MKRYTLLGTLLSFMLITLGAGCSPSTPPDTFVQTDSPKALTLEISGEYLADDAWVKVTNYLQDEFGLEVEDKTNGIIETAWQYPSTGRLTKSYRFRLKIQFSENRYTMTIQPEAQFQQKALLGIYHWWLTGGDPQLTEKYYTALNKLVGKIP